MDAPQVLKTASLRRTALVYVTVLLSLVGFAASALAYFFARDAATEFLDGQLRQIALNAGVGVSAPDAPGGRDQDPEDQFAVSIWDTQGSSVHESLPSVHIPLQPTTGYADAVAAGEDWRVYTTRDARRTVQVAQREVVRHEIARTAALGAAAPVLIAIPLAWLVVGWAMNRVLARLNTLSIELSERSVGATAPIPLDGVPAEVAPAGAEHESPDRPAPRRRRSAAAVRFRRRSRTQDAARRDADPGRQPVARDATARGASGRDSRPGPRRSAGKRARQPVAPAGQAR